MKLHSKYLISSFIVVACCLQQCCLGQSSTVRPYKFGFTIDEQQHRSEQRDERGIVMGEFGFITADGIYHVTVYATDEQGRFRILAMKNYPYESPPKTVEVMVQPKITPTTTTTSKPLARHNFNTEACSGCFLTNGNNKPKGINGIDAKPGKSDIRPLSKSLPSPGSNSAANNKSPNNNPATGNISDLSGEHVLLTFKSNENVIKLNTPLTKSLEFKDFTALKNAVKSQQIFSTAPSTLAPIKVVSTALTMALNKVGSTTSALAHNKVVLTTSTLAHNKIVTTPSNLTPNKVVTTTSTLAPNKAITTPSNKAITITSTHARHNIVTNAAKEHATGNHVTSTADDLGNILVNQNKSVTKTLQIPLQIPNNLPQHNAPLDKRQFQVVALSMTNANGTPLFTDKNEAIINNVLKPLKTKSIQFLKHNLYTPTQTTEQEKAFTQKTPTPTPKNALQSSIEQNSNTDTTPLKEQNVKTDTKSQGNNYTPVKNLPTETRLIPQAASSATLNNNSGKLAAPTTNTLNKQYTTQPNISKDTNQITSKPSVGSSGSVTKTNAGNPPPPIMDIIMQKVLPTLMGKKAPTQSSSSTPTQSTTLNNKPNAVPSGKKPSTGNSGFNANKSGGGSSGSSSANGDGDLYRFKYILDYHGHTETGKRNGNKEGSYYAIGDDDVERTIEYVANEFGYQPRIRWRKLDRNEIKSKENTLKDYEFVWFNQ